MAQRKRGRRAYLEDFHQVPGGEYVYTGRMRRFRGDGAARRALFRRLWAASAVLLCAAVCAGCFLAPGVNDCAYVVAPYMACLVSAVSVAWGLFRLSREGETVREYVWEATVKKFPLRTALAAAFAGLAMAGEAVYILRNGAGGREAGAAVFLVCHAAALAAGLVWRRLMGRLDYQ